MATTGTTPSNDYTIRVNQHFKYKDTYHNIKYQSDYCDTSDSEENYSWPEETTGSDLQDGLSGNVPDAFCTDPDSDIERKLAAFGSPLYLPRTIYGSILTGRAADNENEREFKTGLYDEDFQETKKYYNKERMEKDFQDLHWADDDIPGDNLLMPRMRPLGWSIFNRFGLGHTNLLLENGCADPNEGTTIWEKPLYLAAMTAYSATDASAKSIIVLLNAGADPNDPIYTAADNPLTEAIRAYPINTKPATRYIDSVDKLRHDRRDGYDKKWKGQLKHKRRALLYLIETQTTFLMPCLRGLAASMPLGREAYEFYVMHRKEFLRYDAECRPAYSPLAQILRWIIRKANEIGDVVPEITKLVYLLLHDGIPAMDNGHVYYTRISSIHAATHQLLHISGFKCAYCKKCTSVDNWPNYSPVPNICTGKCLHCKRPERKLMSSVKSLVEIARDKSLTLISAGKLGQATCNKQCKFPLMYLIRQIYPNEKTVLMSYGYRKLLLFGENDIGLDEYKELAHEIDRDLRITDKCSPTISFLSEHTIH